MDLEFLQDVKQNSHHFEATQHKGYQQCTKCNSLFVEDGICHSCGFNHNIHPLGEPLGEKSFYTMKENYWESLSIFEKENIKFFRDELKHKHYLNKIKFRYNDLISFFYSPLSYEDVNRPVFLQELRDIIIEMKNLEVSEEEIWKPVDLDSTEEGSQSLYQRINDVLKECRLEAINSRSLMLKNKKAGFFSLANLLFWGLVMTLFMSVLMAVFAIKTSTF